MIDDDDDDNYPYGDPPPYLPPAERGLWIGAREARLKYDAMVAQTESLLAKVLRLFEIWDLPNWRMGDDSAWEHEFIIRMASLRTDEHLTRWLKDKPSLGDANDPAWTGAEEKFSPTGRLPRPPEMQNLPDTLAHALEMLCARHGTEQSKRVIQNATEMTEILRQTVDVLEDGLQDEAHADWVREKARAILNKIEDAS